MATREFNTNINLNRQYLLNAALQNLATFPSTSADPTTGVVLPAGFIFWHTGHNTAYCYTGLASPNQWLDLGNIYTHPTFSGVAQPSSVLTGANVISQITLDNGHVTGVQTRAITPGEIGAATTSHTHNFADVIGVPANTILANNTGSTSVAKAVTVADLLVMMSIAYGAVGQLTTGTDTTQRTWSAKMIADYVTSRLTGYLTAVNLSYSASATNGTISNTAGTSATIPTVDSNNAGLMTPAQKTKLDGIANNANNYVHPTDNPGAHPFATEQTSGLQVLSQLVVNTEGHVVTVKGRNLTNADIATILINNATTSGTYTWSSSKINTEIQNAITQAQTGALQYKGEYDPVTNTPDIKVTSPAGTIKAGYTYVVSQTGSFLGQEVEAGDMIIVKTDDPGSTVAKWQIVNKNIPAIVSATTLVQGIIRIATITDYNTNDNTTAVSPQLLKTVLDARVGGYSAVFGNGSSTSFTITHGLNTDLVVAYVRKVADKLPVEVQWAATSTNTVEVNVNFAPANNAYEIIIKK